MKDELITEYKKEKIGHVAWDTRHPFLAGMLLAIPYTLALFLPVSGLLKLIIFIVLSLIGINIMKRAFQSKNEKYNIFPIGKYALGMQLEKTPDLVEFSKEEYQAFIRRFEEEYNYKAQPIDFLGYSWELMLGTVQNKIYKIAIYLVIPSKNAASSIEKEVLKYCIEKLGKPSSMEKGMVKWDTSGGNVIVQNIEAFNGFNINMYLTSSSVRSFKLRV